MFYRLLARALAVLHVVYVIFVVFGALVVQRWPSLLWLHLLAIVWATATMTSDLGCVLTSWEKALFRLAGQEPYTEGFLEHHLLRMTVSAGHSRQFGVVIGAGVLVVNVALYAVVRLR